MTNSESVVYAIRENKNFSVLFLLFWLERIKLLTPNNCVKFNRIKAKD